MTYIAAYISTVVRIAGSLSVLYPTVAGLHQAVHSPKPGARPGDGISIELEVRSIFAVFSIGGP